jgi:hypothetical protein
MPAQLGRGLLVSGKFVEDFGDFFSFVADEASRRRRTIPSPVSERSNADSFAPRVNLNSSDTASKAGCGLPRE